MLTRFIQWLVAKPLVYDMVQTAVGSKYLQKRLLEQIGRIETGSLALDLGGGTGTKRALLPSSCAYICLDIDDVKLKGYRKKFPEGLAVRASGLEVPIENGSLDLVFCIAVSHHIPDDGIERLASEGLRILKDDGRLVFVDAVWQPRRLTGRLLWRYDRGSFPRRAEVLRDLFSGHGSIESWEEVSILHKYVIGIIKRAE